MIFNMVGGGGGSGATLVVSSPANVSVTVSKDDKFYTKNSGSLGSATFKGLATGTWTVVISGNGQTATRTIEITADYAITIAFFSATINITYPANSNCVVANSGGQTVASDTNTGTSAKTWTATVNAKGTYTITATATDGSGKTKSTTVSITADGQVKTAELVYQMYIFKSGSGLTAGYSVEGSGGEVSKNSISWSGNSDGGGISMYIKPAVSLNNYTKLCFDFECSYNYGGNYGMGFGVGKDAASNSMITNTSWTAKVTNGANSIARNTAQCDISKLTDSEYIKVVGSFSAGKIYNIWLE